MTMPRVVAMDEAADMTDAGAPITACNRVITGKVAFMLLEWMSQESSDRKYSSYK
jgi:hypothetical protein